MLIPATVAHHMRWPLVAAVAIALISCAAPRPTQIGVGAFLNYGDFPAQHTRYIGSDAEYHYFVWAGAPRSGEWKVLKSAMPFKLEWPVDGVRQAFMTKDTDGSWQPKVAGK